MSPPGLRVVRRLRLRCYAKINLGLRVLGRRADGYHDLLTVFQTISLHDLLEAWRERGRAGVYLECDVPELSGPHNLAVRAAELMLEELGWRARLRLRLRKRIPVGAGLGGGSSDAAAALCAVARLAGRRVPPQRLWEMAAGLGADVPFFLLGGTALGWGRGTEVYALPELPPHPLVVIYPRLPVNTAQAYAALPRMSPASGARRRPATPAASLTAWRELYKMFSFCALWEGTEGRLKNDFEPVVFSTYPQLARLKRQLIRAGAFPALLSGSGSAVYGFFDSRQKAERAARAIQARHPGWQVWVARTVPRSVIQSQWR